MTIKEFLELDFHDLDELSTKKNREKAIEAVNAMSKIANRRLEKLSKLDIPSPAFSNRTITDKEGFATRDDYGQFLYERFQSAGEMGDDLTKIRKELKYLHSFLESKTSTVTGAERYLEDIVMRAEGYDTRNDARWNMWTYDESKVFWSAYDKLLDNDFNLVTNIIGSNEVQAVVRKLYKTGENSDSLWERSRQTLRDIRDERFKSAYYEPTE